MSSAQDLLKKNWYVKRIFPNEQWMHKCHFTASTLTMIKRLQRVTGWRHSKIQEQKWPCKVSSFFNLLFCLIFNKHVSGKMWKRCLMSWTRILTVSCPGKNSSEKRRQLRELSNFLTKITTGQSPKPWVKKNIKTFCWLLWDKLCHSSVVNVKSLSKF